MQVVWFGTCAWQDSMGQHLLSMHIVYTLQKSLFSCSSGQCISGWCFSLTFFTFKQVFIHVAHPRWSRRFQVTSPRLCCHHFVHYVQRICKIFQLSSQVVSLK